MYSLCLLPAMLLAVSMVVVWRIRQSGRCELCKTNPLALKPPALLEFARESDGVQIRKMQWKSINEFEDVHTKCRDLIRVDLRPNARRALFPVSTASVFPVTLKEPGSVLERRSVDRSVTICGAASNSVFSMETTRCSEGPAPLYLFEGDSSLEEVA